MLRLATAGTGANMWTQRLGRWLVGEIKNLAAHAAAQAAQWHRERKEEMRREVRGGQGSCGVLVGTVRARARIVGTPRAGGREVCRGRDQRGAGRRVSVAPVARACL